MSGNAETDIAYLTALVPIMRELGVSSFGATVLGPEPGKATPDEPNLTKDERMKLAQREAAERLERLRYGASGGPRPRGRE